MPPSAQSWLSTQQDEATRLEEGFSLWVTAIGNVDKMSSERLYHNSSVLENDLRCHLGSLALLISEGQTMVLQALELRKHGRVGDDFFSKEIKEIDTRVAEFVSRINQWHGTIDSQADIPASLKQAFAEAKAGDVIPFPEK